MSNTEVVYSYAFLLFALKTSASHIIEKETNAPKSYIGEKIVDEKRN